MKINLLLAVLYCFSIGAWAQNDCKSPVLLKDSLVVLSGSKTGLWLKFKAKGSVLNTKVVSSSDGSQLPYTIYPMKSCEYIKLGYVEPTRIVGTGLAVLTNELWQLTLNEGICACDNCLSKVKLSPNRDLNLVQEKMYLMHIDTKGQEVKISSKWSKIDESRKVFSLKADADYLEVGMKFHLKEVQFVPSKTDFLYKGTEQKLDSLYDFLAQNKSIEVIIEGHVNGPSNYKSDRFQQLSSDRAKKIRDYLVAKGINGSRVKSVGKSNTEMRYPRPKTEWQAQQNRRVEVKITSL